MLRVAPLWRYPLGYSSHAFVASLQPVTLEIYHTKMIVGAAIFEGAVFFNLVVYMLLGQVYSLAIAGVMLLYILLLFPAVNGVEDRLQSRERERKETEALSH